MRTFSFHDFLVRLSFFCLGNHSLDSLRYRRICKTYGGLPFRGRRRRGTGGGGEGGRSRRDAPAAPAFVRTIT